MIFQYALKCNHRKRPCLDLILKQFDPRIFLNATETYLAHSRESLLPRDTGNEEGRAHLPGGSQAHGPAAEAPAVWTAALHPVEYDGNVGPSSDIKSTQSRGWVSNTLSVEGDEQAVPARSGRHGNTSVSGPSGRDAHETSRVT